jgi:alkanesulfonate monooxygenase SsuD/methylene tetrahydromethanopterin reductase-like flavin-dependent oxidoreductase (luciferase family)
VTTKFGVLLTQTCSWVELAKQAKSVEAAGFDSLWVADQIANAFGASEWLEGWTALAGLALETESIRIGTLVTNIIYNNPSLIAKKAITVDHMSGGRLELGLGAGGAPSDHAMTGVPYWSGAERQRRFEEFVAIVEQLLTHETSSYEGEFYQMQDTYVSPAPLQSPRPPLVIAAHGPRSMRLAARKADKWSFYEPGSGLVGDQAADAIRRMNAYIDDEARTAERPPESIARSFCCGFAAGSAWQSIDQALSDIDRYEAAGINEFIVTYAPDESFVASGTLDMQTGEATESVFLRNPADLTAFAHAVRNRS